MTDADIRRFEPNPATAELMEKILYEVKRVVVGQDRFLERVMVALLPERDRGQAQSTE